MSNIINPFGDEFKYEIKPNSIFVFPSNYDGHHGKGASYLAMHKFGARRGKSIGLHNYAYAIKIKNDEDEELQPDSIRYNIQQFAQSVAVAAKTSKNLNPFEYLISDFSKELTPTTFKAIASAFSTIGSKGLFPRSFTSFINPQYIVN